MEAATAGKSKEPGDQPDVIKVTVTFPLAGKGPYQADVEPETTVEAVRVAAMEHFGVADSDTTVHYLTHKGTRPDSAMTVGGLADEARAVKLTLAKELIQG